MADDQLTATVISAGKNVDVYTIPALRERLKDAVTRHDRVAVDLEEAEFVDSSGLAMLVGVNRTARAHGCELIVVCTREPILRLFRLTGLNKVLDVRSSACASRG